MHVSSRPTAATLPDAVPEAADSRGLTVLFDGACPLCRREIGVYRGLPARAPIHFVDVSVADCRLPAGTPRSTLLARFHVQRADGALVSGAEAFVTLWAALPGWRWLARAARLPGMLALMELGYRGFLRIRPALQRLARALETPAIPPHLVADLRSDHAGETGAVWIYLGILLIARDAALRDFARRHLDTERRHLASLCEVLPPLRRSLLLLPWRAAGLLTGALPALCGTRAVYATIAAVETFVDRHYQEQLDQWPAHGSHPALRALLLQCQADECHHRDEAMALQAAPAGRWLAAWCALVGRGSAYAVRLARAF